MAYKKEASRVKRHGRIRRKISGDAERPRLVVHRSLKNFYVQVIDDSDSKTLAAVSTRDKEFAKSAAKTPKAKQAEKLGVLFGAQLKEKKITRISFDRGGYQYHGRVKAFAEALRQAGIEF